MLSLKQFWQRFGEELIVKGLAEAVIWAFIFVAGYLISLSIATTLFQGLALFRVYLVLLGIAMGLYVGLHVYRKLSRRPVFAPIDSDFTIEFIQIKYQRKSSSEILYSRKYRLRAEKNGLDRFTDKFRWSGGRMPTMSTTLTEHRIDPHPKGALYHFFDVCFDRAYNKGEIVETEVLWAIDDGDGVSVPFISRTIHEPTNKLTFIVELPSAVSIPKAVGEEAPDASSPRKCVKVEELSFVNGRCEWTPQKLKLLHHYQLRWRNP